MTHSRAFTLVEVMLAGVLGAVVVVAALGLFAILDREQARQKVVAREVSELAFTQEVFERTLRVLLLAEGNRPPGVPPASGSSAPTQPPASSADAGTGGRAGSGSPAPPSSRGEPAPSAGADSRSATSGAAESEGSKAGGASATGAAASVEGRDRFILEDDASQPAIMQFRGRTVAPQRFEVACLVQPAYALPEDALDGRDLARLRARVRADASERPRPPSDRRDAEGRARDGESGVRPAPREYRIADGFRGVFELTLEPPSADPRQVLPTWTLSWRTIASPATAVPPAEADDDPGPSPAAAVTTPPLGEPARGRAILATGLVACRWEPYRNRRFVESYSTRYKEDLPAYVRMTVETASGHSMDWVFEVGWAVGPEPGTVITAAAGAAATGGAAGTAQQPAAGSAATPSAATPTQPTTAVPRPPQPITPVRPIAPAPTPPAPKPGSRPGLSPKSNMRRRRRRRGQAVRPASRRARAFALPIVVFVGFIVVLVSGLLLDLQATARLAVDRQVRAYRNHHTAMGIRELLDQWMLLASGGIESQLDDSGMAFELSGRGASTRVYLFDGQGAALRDPSGAGGRAGLAQDVSRLLSAAPAADVPLLRDAGPVAISINTAPRPVLEAVVIAAGNPGRASAFAQDVLARRRDKRMVQADITDAATKAGLTPEQAADVASMFTATPEIWRIEAVTTSDVDRSAQVRQGGLIKVPGNLSLGSVGVIILSWEDLPDGR